MMKGLLATVQKRIGVLITLIGLVVVVSNIMERLKTGDLSYAISGLEVWPVFIAVLPFIASMFFESRLLKHLQIFMFMFIGGLNLVDAYQEFYGPSLFLAAWLLMRHYGFLEKHAVAKNSAILIIVTGLSQFSAYLYTDEGLYAGFMSLMFTLFLIILLVIIWRDMVRQQEELKRENRSLTMNYREIASQLKELEKDQEPFDLKAVRISPAEERVIKTLTLYKASNREIAERLNLAESTVKLHLYNIYNKIGVDNRFAIIDLCKYNFTSPK